MSIETFVYIAEQIGCDLNAALKQVTQNDEVKQILGDKFNDFKKTCSDKTKTIAYKVVVALKLLAPYAGLATEIIKHISSKQ